MLTALLARLPDATNCVMIDQVAVDFAFLNSKAARKRLVRVCATACFVSELSISHQSAVHEPNSEESAGRPTALLETYCHSEQIYA